MKKLTQFENVKEAGTSKSLPAGGYICEITKVEDIEAKEYLNIEFDIADGEYKGYYAELNERANFWGGKCIRSYKEKAIPMFKRMCSAVAASNPGYSFNPFVKGGNADEQSLVGKKVGIVLGEEEYVKNNGETGTRLKVAYECDIQKIIDGKFKVPDKKCLEQTNNSTDFMAVGDEEESPFN